MLKTQSLRITETVKTYPKGGYAFPTNETTRQLQREVYGHEGLRFNSDGGSLTHRGRIYRADGIAFRYAGTTRRNRGLRSWLTHECRSIASKARCLVGRETSGAIAIAFTLLVGWAGYSIYSMAAQGTAHMVMQ